MNQLEELQEMESLTRTRKFGLLSLIPVYFIVIGLSVQSIPEIGPGIVRIIREPGFLITGHSVVGGVGAALVNAGMLTPMSIGIIYFMGMDMDGYTTTSNCLMFGFLLFEKDLLDIRATLAGVYLYAKCHKAPMRRHIYIGLYGTSLSPIITQLMQVGSQPVIVCLFISTGVGLIIGFVLSPLSTHVHYAHKGYSLYNVGFVAGTIVTVIVSVIKSLGMEVETGLVQPTSHNRMFGILLFLLFAGTIVLGVAVRGKGIIESYCRILKSYGIGGTDYPKDGGGATTAFSMGVNGSFVTSFSFAVGEDLSGPTICGIFTIVGFSSTGKHLRNTAPIMLGAYLVSFTKIWEIYQSSPMLAPLFPTTLASMVGEFGAVAGMIASSLHSSVALNVGIVYDGMNLHNSGYAGEIVAIFMVPVMQSIRDRKARARGGLSLQRKTLQKQLQDQYGSAVGQGDLEQAFAPVDQKNGYGQDDGAGPYGCRCI